MLNLDCNSIGSVQNIVDRIENDRNCFISKSIRILGMGDNVISDNVMDNPKEKAALLGLLKSVNSIYDLGDSYYDSDVEYALLINHAGRRIVEGSGGDSGGRSLPLSVWPTILERACNKSPPPTIFERASSKSPIKRHICPTGLYYLLRNGPVLFGRPDLGSTTFCYGDGIGGSHVKKKNSLKRKFLET